MVALPFCNLRLQGKKPREKAYPREVVSIGDAIRKRRLDLDLRQKDAAEIIGCDECTITNWEKGRSSPRIGQVGKVVEFLGYNPFPEGTALAEGLVNFRKAHGMRQKDMAARLGIDPSTLASYEQGHQPAEQCRLLLTEFLDRLGTVPRNESSQKQ